MSKIPDDVKSKYNKNEPYAWVDSQWEKFMIEQKELKAKIVELEEKSKNDDDYMYSLEEEVNRLKNQLRDLIVRVPSSYLTTVKFSGEIHPDAKHKSWDEIEEQKYIYERNPDTGQVYRRKFNDYNAPRELVDSEGNPYLTQMELFEV